MRAYVAFCAKSFTENLAYRSEVWLRTVGNLVSIFIQVTIWRAILGAGASSGISSHDMVTYVILNAVVSTVLMDSLFREVDEKLRTGSIIVDLIKPVDYPLFVASRQLGKSAFQFVFTVIPTLTLSWFLFGFNLPPTLGYGLAFIASLAMAMAVSFSIGYLIALLAFWFLATMHFEWTLGGLIKVFSGSFLPIWFFSPGWAAVAHVLPFQFMGFVPAAMYMGRIPAASIWPTLGLGVLWTVALLGVTNRLWTRAIKRLVVQGG